MSLWVSTSPSLFSEAHYHEVLAPFGFAFGYLDDILIFSPDIETHLQHLESIFARL